MKTLYLMRHAKSSRDNETLADFDRPLSKSGKLDAAVTGQLMFQKGVLPEEIFSSSAERSLETARYFCPEINFSYEKVKRKTNLYAASPRDMLAVIKGIPETVQSVLLLGHNPGLTDLLNYLTGLLIGKIPTSGIVELLYSRNSWMDIEISSCQIGFWEHPKKYAER